MEYHIVEASVFAGQGKVQLSSAWLHPVRSWCNGCKGPNTMLPLQPCLAPSPALKQVLCFVYENVTRLVTLQPFVRLEPITHDPCVFVFSCTGRLWPCLAASWVSNVPLYIAGVHALRFLSYSGWQEAVCLHHAVL